MVTYTRLRDLQPDKVTRVPSVNSGKLKHLGSTRRRQQYQCARNLLRLTLERWTGEPALSHQIITTETGKPICVDGPAVTITHSGNHVACAVTDSGDIGIDLEVPLQHRRISGIARLYFSSEEADWLDTQTGDYFYMLWVLKEAYSKAVGCGLTGLNRLRCKVLPPRIEATAPDDILGELGLYLMEESYLALATTKASLGSVVFERWDAGARSLVSDRASRIIAMSSGDAA